MPPISTDSGPMKEIFPGRPMAGEEHMRWLIDTVMPRVERSFRVAAGPENTAIGGASLGGLISLYGGATHPEIFGMVLAESPSLEYREIEIGKLLFSKVRTWPGRVYVAMGDQEMGPEAQAANGNARLVSAARELGHVLEQKGLGPDRRLLVIDPGARHGEPAWAKRLPGALRFIFPADLDMTK